MAAIAYIGLGSNLGDRAATLQGALDALNAHPRIDAVRCSRRIETEPVGGPSGQPRYLNAVAELTTTLGPDALLALLQTVETRFGRTRSVPNAPRTLDLDLLLYDDLCRTTPELTIPHPHMHERRFVMGPLAEIAPDAWHPVVRKTAGEILTELSAF